MGAWQGVKWPNYCVRLVLLFCQKYMYNWLSDRVISQSTEQYVYIKYTSCFVHAIIWK